MAEYHRGTDYRAPIGTPVLAMCDCVIVGKWTETEGGLCMAMATKCPDGSWPEPRSYFFQGMATEGRGGHDDSGFRITYAHLSAYAPTANVGAVCRRGDVVAQSGASGQREDGSPVAPHLHVMVEYLQDGWIDTRVFIDPQLLVGATIDGRQPVQQIPPGQYVAPQGALIQPSQAPAAQAKPASVVINVDGSGVASINMGNGASVAGTVSVLPGGVF